MANRTLSSRSFEAARRYLVTAARPLEAARFQHAFGGASVDAVVDELARFQNRDGGFGRALEPDVRAPESSALCTSIALRILHELGSASARETERTRAAELARSGVDYLLSTVDRERGRWRIIPQSAVQSPHAPWWNHASGEELFASFGLNPTVELLGYLYDAREQVDSALLSAVGATVMEHFAGIESIEMHELLCYLRLYRSPRLPGELRERLGAKLPAFIERSVVFESSKWSEYGLRPLQVFDAPGAPFIAGHEEAVAANLDFEIATQSEDGSWSPTWSWGDAYPHEWTLARREWAGVLTLEKLTALKRFGRIE